MDAKAIERLIQMSDNKELAFILAARNAMPALLAMAEDYARLKALEAKLPKTADGVAIVPGMKLYKCGDTRTGKPNIWIDWGSVMEGEHHLFFSTREAAALAKPSPASANKPTTEGAK